VQKHVENSSGARKQERAVSGEGAAIVSKGNGLPDLGVAPPLHADGDWINANPFTLAQQRGKVVLVDFWTYSCINCLRTFPHLKAWYAAYHAKGFQIVGVHTPEFAFEHVSSNVRAAVKRLGIDYPVVQDNKYDTWDDYANQYWPAEYLIDKTGHVRHTHFGEGEYGKTETLIRRLLGAHGPSARQMADATPTESMTPETYLGFGRLSDYAGSTISPDIEASYKLPSMLQENALAYGGTWRVGKESIVAGKGARLRLHFIAKNVYIVLGGHGTVQALVDGKPTRTIKVDAERLYTVRSSSTSANATLELRFSPGLKGYSFTFG
jgi:thiol-disulfide isomerase/thioredoxin